MAKLKQLTEQEMNENKKRFKKLFEYSFVNQEDDLLLDEDDDDPNSDNGQANNTDVIPDQNAQVNTDNSAADTDQSGEPSIDTGVDQNVQPSEPAQEVGEPETEMPAESQPEINEPSEDETTIDVTDLTDKQEDVDSKVSLMADQTKEMMNMLSQLSNKVQGIIKNTDSEISSLKSELVKRNPTPVETLQKRITVSDPFTQTPGDYWNKKEAEGNYRLSDDEDENKEYVLNASDIDDGNPSDVYKSFGLDDDEMNQSISTMFKL